MATAFIFETPHGTWTNVTNRALPFAVIAREKGCPSPECLAFFGNEAECQKAVTEALESGLYEFVEVHTATRTEHRKSARRSWNGIIDWDA
jgi:hypothetical protein